MSADIYLQTLLTRESVNVATGILSPAWTVQATIHPVISEWAGNQLLGVSPSGSFAKGTANRSGTDVDLFISLSETTTQTLKEIYAKLFQRMNERGYNPERQNVS